MKQNSNKAVLDKSFNTTTPKDNATTLSYKPYISGLKGFACLMVMLGHFLGVFNYAENFPDSIGIIDKILGSKFSFVVNESFWLYLFFIVSGYLLSRNPAKRIRELISKGIFRFFRLALPIFFAYLIIYIISLTVGFHNSETIDLFSNEWFQKAVYGGQYSLYDVLKSPVYVLVLGKCSLNSPYWVLKDMLIASYIIYILGYLRYRFPKCAVLLDFACLAFALFGGKVSSVISACVAGMLVLRFEENIGELFSNRAFAVSAISTSFLMYILSRREISYFFFASLIILLPKTKVLNAIFSSKIADWLGKISFGIYSFHWPLYCSVGALIMISVGNVYGVLAAIVCCWCITILLSIIYNITFERFSSFVIKKAKKLVSF